MAIEVRGYSSNAISAGGVSIDLPVGRLLRQGVLVTLLDVVHPVLVEERGVIRRFSATVKTRAVSS